MILVILLFDPPTSNSSFKAKLKRIDYAGMFERRKQIIMLTFTTSPLCNLRVKHHPYRRNTPNIGLELWWHDQYLELSVGGCPIGALDCVDCGVRRN